MSVPPMMIDGVRRRSYVLRKELVPPLIVLESVSGDGSDERDPTPESGKFRVYERAIRARYHGIFEDEGDSIEMYELVHGLCRRMAPDHRGRYPIPEMGVELGTGPDTFMGQSGPWLRWYGPDGGMIPIGHEIAERNARLAAREADRATREADRLAAQLRALGIEPEA